MRPPSSETDQVPRVGRLEATKLGQHVAADELEGRQVVTVGGAQDDVLDAGLGQVTETLHELVRGLGLRSPVVPAGTTRLIIEPPPSDDPGLIRLGTCNVTD